MDNNIVALKLVTTEDIIGEIVSENTDTFLLKNVVGVAITRQNGQPVIGLVPFPQFAEPRVDTILQIDRIHVVYRYIPSPDFVENYNQIFGAGIIVPQKQLLRG